MNREALIAAMQKTAANKPSPVEVPGWGTVYFRQLTVEEVGEQAREEVDKKDPMSIAKAACRIICNEKGELIFNKDDQKDLKIIAAQPWALLQKILAASQESMGVPLGNSASARNS